MDEIEKNIHENPFYQPEENFNKELDIIKQIVVNNWN